MFLPKWALHYEYFFITEESLPKFILVGFANHG